jgi:hypothetical protein
MNFAAIQRPIVETYFVKVTMQIILEALRISCIPSCPQ